MPQTPVLIPMTLTREPKLQLRVYPGIMDSTRHTFPACNFMFAIKKTLALSLGEERNSPNRRL